MAYELEFTRSASRELVDLYKGLRESEKRHFENAFVALQSNPYPTNPNITSGSIVRLKGTEKWRFKVSHDYRIVYLIRGQIVVIERVRHRKDVYRQ